MCLELAKSYPALWDCDKADRICRATDDVVAFDEISQDHDDDIIDRHPRVIILFHV